jgi:hypothetical protein
MFQVVKSSCLANVAVDIDDENAGTAPRRDADVGVRPFVSPLLDLRLAGGRILDARRVRGCLPGRSHCPLPQEQILSSVIE